MSCTDEPAVTLNELVTALLEDLSLDRNNPISLNDDQIDMITMLIATYGSEATKDWEVAKEANEYLDNIFSGMGPMLG